MAVFIGGIEGLRLIGLILFPAPIGLRETNLPRQGRQAEAQVGHVWRGKLDAMLAACRS